MFMSKISRVVIIKREKERECLRMLYQKSWGLKKCPAFNDDDDDELFLWYGWPTKGVALFPAGTIVRDPHHRESPTRREQGLNLRRIWVQA